MSIKSSDPFPMFTWDIETGIPGEKLRATNPDNIVMYAKEDGIKLNAVKIGIFDIEFTTEPEFNQSDEMVKNYDIKMGIGQLTVIEHKPGGGSSSNSANDTRPPVTDKPGHSSDIKS